jgi:hypothetical protein
MRLRKAGVAVRVFGKRLPAFLPVFNSNSDGGQQRLCLADRPSAGKLDWFMPFEYGKWYGRMVS